PAGDDRRLRADFATEGRDEETASLAVPELLRVSHFDHDVTEEAAQLFDLAPKETTVRTTPAIAGSAGETSVGAAAASNETTIASNIAADLSESLARFDHF